MSWSCIPQTLLVLLRRHMENYLRYSHFRTKVAYKRVSIVLAARRGEQKSNSRFSSVPTIAAVHAFIKMQFSPKATSGPAYWRVCGLQIWNDNSIFSLFLKSAAWLFRSQMKCFEGAAWNSPSRFALRFPDLPLKLPDLTNIQSSSDFITRVYRFKLMAVYCLLCKRTVE